MRYFASIITVAFLVTLFTASQGLGAGQEGAFQQDAEQQRFGMQDQQSQISANQLSSNQVRKLQESLQQKGADPGQIDGVMGPNTEQAIREFQQDEGIASTGQVNRETLEALDLEAQEFMGAAPAFGERGVEQRDQQAGQLSSTKIRELQEALQNKGADPGVIDGIMGPNTRQAISEFQQDEGIAATGQLNEQTLEALDLEVQEFMGAAPRFEQREQREQPGAMEMERETQRDGMQQRDPQPGKNGMNR